MRRLGEGVILARLESFPYMEYSDHGVLGIMGHRPDWEGKAEPEYRWLWDETRYSVPGLLEVQHARLAGPWVATPEMAAESLIRHLRQNDREELADRAEVAFLGLGSLR
jgi:hypothetical protein